MRSHLAAFFAGGLFAVAAIAQALPQSSPRERDRYSSLDAFAESLSYITNNYVEEVDDRTLLYGAIDGMVSRLDRFSAFVPPSRYKRLREDTEGDFGGVGISLARAKGAPGFPIVSNVVVGSPAARCGIKVGDRVTEIDGNPTAVAGNPTRSTASWHSALRGPAGTSVRVELMRDARRIHCELIRQQLKVPTVAHQLVDGRIGYIEIRRFLQATSADVLEALRDLSRDAGGQLGALMLDLRGNPGGLLDQAIAVADLLIADGTIVKVVSRRGLTEVERARRPGTWSGFPVLVLVDGESASSAEILTAALQDHGRATVLGARTFGKGSVQTFLDLSDGSGLKLTTSRYLTPSGRSLQGVGITPDIEVQSRAGHGDRAESGSSEAGANRPKDARIENRAIGDPQLSRALATARGWLNR